MYGKFSLLKANKLMGLTEPIESLLTSPLNWVEYSLQRCLVQLVTPLLSVGPLNHAKGRDLTFTILLKSTYCPIFVCI